MELDKYEIELLLNLITDQWDRELHYPDDYTDVEKEASSTVYEKVKLAEKQLRTKRV